MNAQPEPQNNHLEFHFFMKNFCFFLLLLMVECSRVKRNILDTIWLAWYGWVSFIAVDLLLSGREWQTFRDSWQWPLPLLLTVSGIATLSLSLLYCCAVCRFTEHDFWVSINICTNGPVELATLWVETRHFKECQDSNGQSGLVFTGLGWEVD